MRQKGKIWKDHTGKGLATYAINPVIRLEDQFANQIADEALKVEKHLCRLLDLTRKAHSRVYQAKLVDAKIKERKRPVAEGMTINAFDNSVQVKITMPDSMYFDHTYTELVKEKFDEYFSLFGTDNEELQFMRDLVNDLLYTSGGRLDNNRVLRLRKYRDRIQLSKKLSCKSEVFLEAVDLFDKAIKTKPGNMGIYVDVRDAQGKMRRVPIKYTDV